MAGERPSRRMAEAVSSQRRRRGLSNITNLPAINHWSNENEVVKSWNNSRELELEQENRRLQQVILDKDGQIESQKLYIQQMQRDYLTNLFRRTQQNEDIICYNSRLSKELLSVREQLKFLQHAHTQMAVVYKINENELQMKLAEMSQQLRKALQEKECEEEDLQVQIPRRTRTSLRRLSVNGGLNADMGNPSAKASPVASDIDTTTITTRSSSRQRSGSTSYGESSLKAKIKEQDCATFASSGLYTGSQKRYNNRYGHISGLETMQELCEDLETAQAHTVTAAASTVTVRRSQRRSSVECYADELTDQSSCSGRHTSDVASASESCSRSAENTRYCEKSPGPRSCTPQRPSIPQRPSTPKKRLISQPATSPRMKVEPQTKSPLRIKATTSSQASTPHSASSPVVLSSSLKRRPRASTPALQQHDVVDQSRKSLAGTRPIRRAAELVVSYKEPSLITKMRRPA